MKKSILFAALILILTSSSLWAGSPSHMHSVTFFGFDPVTRLENKVTQPGISLGQELYASLGRSVQLGGGFRYLFTRDLENDEQLTLQPIYASVKVMVPGLNIPFYLKGSAGYTFVQGNDSFTSGRSDLTGGLYFLAGAGVDIPFFYTDLIRFSFIFDMGYASYHGSYKNSSGSSKNFNYTTLDMLAGLGIRF